MNPLLFILKKNFKNSVKDLKKRPFTMAAYIVLLIMATGMIGMSFFMPTHSLRRNSPEVFGAVSTAALMTFVYFGIKQGISSGKSFFLMADVNLVFTAPISPKKVMVYGFIQQLIASLMIMLFISFQIPNLQNQFSINGQGVLIIYSSVFLLFLTMQLIGMLIYSVASKSSRSRSNLEKMLNTFVFLFLGGFLVVLLQQQNLMKAAVLYLNMDFFSFLPFLGWFKSVLNGAVTGISASFYVNMALVLMSLIAMVYGVYKLNPDYYEDVLAATERRQQLIAAKKSGDTGYKFRNAKLNTAHQKYKGSGASAIFYRHMLEFKKSGFFFINKTTFIIVGIGIASKYFFSGIASTIPSEAVSMGMGSGDFTFKSVLFSSIYVLFFLSMQGKWAQELNKPFIYLLPASSISKVLYATLAETLKNGLDGLILFIVAGVMFKADLLTILFSAAAYVTFSLIYTYGDILSRRIFGGTHSKNLEFFFKLFLILFIVVPELVISLVLYYSFRGTMAADLLFYGSIILYNVIASLTILFFCKGIFEQLEMK